MGELSPLKSDGAGWTMRFQSCPKRKNPCRRTEGMHQRRREEQGHLQQQVQAGREAIAALPNWQTKLKETEAAEAELEMNQQEAIGRKGHLEGLVSRLEELAREIAANSPVWRNWRTSRALTRSWLPPSAARESRPCLSRRWCPG